MARVSNRDAVDHLRVRAEMTSHTGSLRATGLRTLSGIGGASAGRLPAAWAARFYADREAGIVYLVWSYGTPIGWVTSAGDYVIPDVRHSVTTSRHQSILHRAWSAPEFRQPYSRTGETPALITELQD